jgi:hypothetical protein
VDLEKSLKQKAGRAAGPKGWGISFDQHSTPNSRVRAKRISKRVYFAILEQSKAEGVEADRA